MGCKYCNMEGDLYDDDFGERSCIMNDKFEFGILGTLGLEQYISNCNKENAPVIETQFELELPDADARNVMMDLGVKRVPINYCPFCGRQLRGFKAVDMLHKLEDLMNEVPQPLSVRCSNCIRRAGFIYLEELSYVRDVDIIRIRNLGRRCFDELKDLMDRYNVSFSDLNVIEEHLDKFEVGEQIKYMGGDFVIQKISYPMKSYYRIPWVFLNPTYGDSKSIEIYHPCEILLMHKLSSM